MTTKQQSSKLQLTPFSEQLDQRIHWRLGMNTKQWSYKWTLFSTFNDDAVCAAQGVFHFEACMRENWNNNYYALLCKG